MTKDKAKMGHQDREIELYINNEIIPDVCWVFNSDDKWKLDVKTQKKPSNTK